MSTIKCPQLTQSKMKCPELPRIQNQLSALAACPASNVRRQRNPGTNDRHRAPALMHGEHQANHSSART